MNFSSYACLLFFIIWGGSPAEAKVGQNTNCSLQASSGDLQSLQNFNAELAGYTESNIGTLIQEATIFGKDDRAEPLKIYPYTTIGKLISNGKGCASLCTATLISACHILTARHCVKDEKRSSNPEIQKIADASACEKDGTLKFIGSNGKESVVKTEFVQTGLDGKAEEDFAFAKISEPLGKELGYMSVMRKSPSNFPDGTKVEALGFNGDINGGDKLTGDKNASIVRFFRKSNMLTLRADMFGGASGGPVIAHAQNGVPYIAGVNSSTSVEIATGQMTQKYVSENSRDRSVMSNAVSSEVFYERMVKYMRANPCP